MYFQPLITNMLMDKIIETMKNLNSKCRSQFSQLQVAPWGEHAPGGELGVDGAPTFIPGVNTHFLFLSIRFSYLGHLSFYKHEWREVFHQYPPKYSFDKNKFQTLALHT
jgi:hypothetical protein